MVGINRIAWKMSRRPVPLASRQAEAPLHWPHIPCDSFLSYMRRVLACQSRCCRNLRGEERHSLDQPFVGHSGLSRPGFLLSRRDSPRRRQEIRPILSPPFDGISSFNYGRMFSFVIQFAPPVGAQKKKLFSRGPAVSCGNAINCPGYDMEPDRIVTPLTTEFYTLVQG